MPEFTSLEAVDRAAAQARSTADDLEASGGAHLRTLEELRAVVTKLEHLARDLRSDAG